jgi:GTPase SAR1 family protein
MNQDKYFDKFNIMIIGDEKVGKSSILERYIFNIPNINTLFKLDILTKNLQMTENKQWEWSVTIKINTSKIKNI